MTKLGTIQVTIFPLDPSMSMLDWEQVQEWMGKTDGWDGWTEERVDEYNRELMEMMARGEMKLGARAEVYDCSLPADLFSAQGWSKEHRGAQTMWHSPWFKPDGMDAVVDQLVDKLHEVLSQLKGGGYRKLCEETNENEETK